MGMNRREMLLTTAGGLTALSLPCEVPAKIVSPVPPLPKPAAPKWFTHRELMNILKKVSKHSAREEFDFDNPIDWEGCPQQLHELFYLATLRMTNIMHRKTLDGSSKHWIVMSPALIERETFFPFQFGVWSNPGSRDGVWRKIPWREARFSQEVSLGVWQEEGIKEVTPRVWRVGTMSCKWGIYVDERFPEDIAMLGMGHKSVLHHRQTGKTERMTLNEGTIHEKTYDQPIYEAYLGPPTTNFYATIRHVPGGVKAKVC